MQRILSSLAVGLVVITFLSGCGLAYESNSRKMLQNATEADFGSKPPDNYKDQEKEMILSNLKDPDSAKVEFVNLRKASIPSGFASPKPILVWVSDVRVNAKNSYGGYTGFQPYHFAWRDGRIIATAVPNVTADGIGEGYWNYYK